MGRIMDAGSPGTIFSQRPRVTVRLEGTRRVHGANQIAEFLSGCPILVTIAGFSVLNVKRVPQRQVQGGSLCEAQVADSVGSQELFRKGQHVVAADDACFGESLF